MSIFQQSSALDQRLKDFSFSSVNLHVDPAGVNISFDLLARDSFLLPADFAGVANDLLSVLLRKGFFHFPADFVLFFLLRRNMGLN
jgi:hypothetical protein